SIHIIRYLAPQTENILESFALASGDRTIDAVDHLRLQFFPFDRRASSTRRARDARPARLPAGVGEAAFGMQREREGCAQEHQAERAGEGEMPVARELRD